MRLVGLIIALILAIGAGYVVVNVMQNRQPPSPTAVVQTTTTPDVQTTPILVAAHAIPIGEVLTPEMMKTQDWPAHLVLDGFVTSGDKSKNLIGMVTRTPFQEGEPILMTKLSNPEDPNFLAAGLPEGRKVTTISVDNISSVAGFIYPGDHVDVLVTHELPNPDADKDAGQATKEKITEILLSNVKVLAVDNRATAGQETAEQAKGAEKRPPTSVSLEVTLPDAQKLRLGQETGYLSLALRSLKDKEKQDTADPTHIQNLTLTNAFQSDASKKDHEPIRVVRGTQAMDIKIGGSVMSPPRTDMTPGVSVGPAQAGSAAPADTAPQAVQPTTGFNTGPAAGGAFRTAPAARR